MNYFYLGEIFESIQLCAQTLRKGLLSKCKYKHIYYMIPKNLGLNNPRRVDITLKSINEPFTDS